MTGWLERAQAAAVRGVLGLPDPVRNRLAGRPIVVDGQRLDPEAQLILRLERLYLDPAVESVAIPRGRQLLDKQCRLVGGRPPRREVRDLVVAGRPARHYLPGASDALLVFFHGGGWVYGGLESHDALCRVIADRTNIPVLAVDYRLAPEAPFPAAYDDCWAAYQWVVEHAAQLGADPARLAVGGDSAGGTLATTVAIAAARAGLPLALQWLIYPATDMTASAESRRTFAHGYYLTEAFTDLGRASYLPDEAAWTDPVASPLLADLPAGLAPAFVATAGFDPLRDEGEAYADRLEASGVPVERRRFEGQVHGFLNVVGVGRSARACVDESLGALARGLAREVAR